MLNPDVLRFVIAAEGLIMGAMMLAINLLYFKVWLGVRQADGSSPAGLLPKHIAGISLSYAILTYGLVIGNINRLGQPGTWTLYLYVIGLAVGVYALWVMGKRQSRRISIDRKPVSISVEEGSSYSQKE